MHFTVRCSLQERLAQREERLKSLTATIKAKEQARQEPGEFPIQYTFQRCSGFYDIAHVAVVRKAAIIADVSRMPARRRRACGFRSRKLEEEQSASTSKLGENYHYGAYCAVNFPVIATHTNTPQYLFPDPIPSTFMLHAVYMYIPHYVEKIREPCIMIIHVLIAD